MRDTVGKDTVRLAVACPSEVTSQALNMGERGMKRGASRAHTHTPGKIKGSYLSRSHFLIGFLVTDTLAARNTVLAETWEDLARISSPCVAAGARSEKNELCALP